jgi:outer membrane protein assembly factor BamA
MIRFLIIISLFPLFLSAQLPTDTTKKIRVLPVPVLFRTPETGWAYGFSVNANFKTTFHSDSLTRISTVTLLAIFSQRQQNVQGIDATIYFPKEKYILYFQSAHTYFPDKFWGIGPLTQNKAEEKYSYEQLYITPHIKRKFSKNLFFGLLADYQQVFKVSYLPDGVFDSTNFIGKSPYQTFGMGATASYDTRNSTFWPTKGVFAQTQFTSYNKELASTYSFNKWMTELRVFIPLFKGHILAGQLYNLSTFGDTPFRSMASFGGQGNMRGFYQGRYRDNSMYSAIIEYRAHIIWRLSACAFGGVGDVYQNFSKINASTLKCSFGGGLRLSLLEKEKYHLRFDYGYSDKYNQAFYFTIGECF